MASRKTDGPQKLPSKPTKQRISLKTASDYTRRYQRSAPASEKAGFFFADHLKALLAQPGVYGMRIYHGLDAKGTYRMVLVGVDREGNDITRAAPVSLPAGAKAKMAASTSSDALILDTHLPCPPWCPGGSPL